jgi:hypothetical protein
MNKRILKQAAQELYNAVDHKRNPEAMNDLYFKLINGLCVAINDDIIVNDGNEECSVFYFRDALAVISAQ